MNQLPAELLNPSKAAAGATGKEMNLIDWKVSACEDCSMGKTKQSNLRTWLVE